MTMAPATPTLDGTNVIDLDAPSPTVPRQILQLCTRYQRGGSEQRVRDVHHAFPESSHTVVIGADSDPLLLREHLPSAEVIVEPALCREPNPVLDARAVARVRRLIHDRQFDVVVTHQSKAGVIGRISARLAKGPPVVHSLSMASFGPGYGPGANLVYRPIEKLLSGWTDAYAVVGRDLAERFARIGVDQSKLHVVRSGVRLPAEAERFGPSARRHLAEAYGLPPDRPWMLYLGSLEDRKNVMSLPILELLLLTMVPPPGPHLIVAGEGPRHDDLVAMISRMGLSEACSVLGYVSDPFDLLGAADVLVLLSQAEGLPQVLVQAAVLGTWFVCCEVDGVDELLDLGAGGSVVDQGDIIGAAKAVARRLMAAAHEPAPRPSPAHELCSWEQGRVADDYASVIAFALARRAAAGR
jgi:glycosyltransferase involved in cell wall biosynthesis